MSEFSTVVIRNAAEPIGLGDCLYGGVISGAAIGDLMEEVEQYKREIDRLQETVNGLDRQNDYLADEIAALNQQQAEGE